MGPLELAATLLTAIMFLANLAPSRAIIVAGTTGTTSPIPLASTLANCAFWLKYGVLLNQPAIILVNIIGIITATVALYVFCKHAENKESSQYIVLRTIGIIYIVYLYIWLMFSAGVVDQLGLLASLSSIAMYGSPLLSLANVFKSKSTAGHISITMSSISLVVCILWTMFGYQIHDQFVIVPNFVGVVLCLVQVLTYIAYSGNMHIPLPTHSDIGIPELRSK